MTCLNRRSRSTLLDEVMLDESYRLFELEGERPYGLPTGPRGGLRNVARTRDVGLTSKGASMYSDPSCNSRAEAASLRDASNRRASVPLGLDNGSANSDFRAGAVPLRVAP